MPLDRCTSVLTVRLEKRGPLARRARRRARGKARRVFCARRFRRGVAMLTRWDPFVDFARLSRDFLDVPFVKENGAPRFAPLVDVVEEKDAFVLTAEVPGLKAEDVKVD